MNVLLITFSFPPAGGVGVLRALSLAKYLPDHDMRVDVLTARNAPAVGRDESLLRQVPSAVTVHHSWTLDLPFTLRKALKKLVSSAKRKSSGTPSGRAASPARPGFLQRVIGNLLLPDPQVGWLPFALPAARRIIRKRKINVLLVTVPPFSSVRLVTRLRAAFPDLPIVLDFRDEWLSTTLQLVSFNNNEKARAVASRCEAEGVRDATRVVLVTRAAQAELASRYPAEQPEKFCYVPNGYDSVPVRPSVRDGEALADLSRPLTLTYIGTVYGSTHPGSFVEAVLGLPPELRARLSIRYIGHIETAALRECLLQLGQTVQLQGFVPQAEALQAMQSTDYLLLITHDRINVAAKFYDYLSGGKPILAAVQPEGDVRRLLEETGAGVWADVNDPDAIRALLTQVLSSTGAIQSTRQPEKIAQYHRSAITGKYAALLHSLKPLA